MAGGLPQNCATPEMWLSLSLQNTQAWISQNTLRNTQAWNGSCKGEEGVARRWAGEVTAGVSTAGRKLEQQRLWGGVQSLREVTEEVGEGCGRRGRGRSCLAASGLASEGTWSHSSRKEPPLQVEAGLPPEALGDLTRLSSLPR